jgi:hypothetical protein
VTTTVAVLVSVVPVPLSVPGAAPPSFWVTPNQGSAPITNALLAGVATMVAVLPEATEAVTDAPVDAVPPLIVTEHQLRKFLTVRVTLPPPPSDPPSAGGAPVSPPDDPLELLLDPPLLELELLDPELLELELLLDTPLELLLEPPLDTPLELVFPASSSEVVAGGGDELLLHAMAPATANTAMLPTPTQFIRFIVLILKASVRAFYTREG